MCNLRSRMQDCGQNWYCNHFQISVEGCIPKQLPLTRGCQICFQWSYTVSFFSVNLQMDFVSCLHFWASGSIRLQLSNCTKKYTFLIVQIIYHFFCLLLIYSLMCFWRHKVLLYPYTTQFLNYTISFSNLLND